MFSTTSVITLWTLLLKCDQESFPRGNYIGIIFPPLLSLWSVPVWLHPQMQLAKLTGPVLPYSNSSRFGGHYCLPVALPKRPASDGFMHLLSPLSRRLGHPIDSAHSKGASLPPVCTGQYAGGHCLQGLSLRIYHYCTDTGDSLKAKEVWQHLWRQREEAPTEGFFSNLVGSGHLRMWINRE